MTEGETEYSTIDRKEHRNVSSSEINIFMLTKGRRAHYSRSSGFILSSRVSGLCFCHSSLMFWLTAEFWVTARCVKHRVKTSVFSCLTEMLLLFSLLGARVNSRLLDLLCVLCVFLTSGHVQTDNTRLSLEWERRRGSTAS